MTGGEMAALVAWGRAVRSRGRWRWRGRDRGVAPLWLFTDAERLPDPMGAVRALPKGLCGIVFRHDGVAGRSQLARRVWQVCRERRLEMVVAGAPVGLGCVGRHVRGGRSGWGPGVARTASAHGVAELVRASRLGVEAVFLSPIFATASHVGGRPLGAVRWAGLSRAVAGVRVVALGGVSGRTVRGVPGGAAGAGAIGGLSVVGANVAAVPQCPAIAMGGGH